MAWEGESAPAAQLRQFAKPVQDLSTIQKHWAFVMKQGTVNHLVVGSIPTQAARKDSPLKRIKPLIIKGLCRFSFYIRDDCAGRPSVLKCKQM